MLVHYSAKKEIGVYDDEIKGLDIPMYYIHSVGSVGANKYIKEFLEVTKQIGHIDILHSHLNAVGGVIAKAAKKAGIEYSIVHCHADITYRGSVLYRYMNEMKLWYLKQFVKKYATDKLACSGEAAERLFDTKENVVVIPNVIYVKDYLPNDSKKIESKKKYGLSNKLVIGAVGRIAPIKNYEFIIDIIHELRLQKVDCEFVCFGRIVDQVYYDSLVERSKKYGIESQIHFLGNSTNVPFDIQCIDVFLMPSVSEGFGMAALEAQAAGIPTIVSTGVPRIVDMGLNAVSFLPIDQPKKWADEISRKCNEKIDISSIVQQFDQAGYNSETAVKRIEDLYISICNS